MNFVPPYRRHSIENIYSDQNDCVIILFCLTNRVDDVRPARMLTKGASDDAKQKVSQALKAIQNRKDLIQPEVERTTLEHGELLSKVQNSQQRAKDAKAQIQQIQKLVSKLNNYKRKLGEAQEKLEIDDEEEKKRLVDGLKQRVLVSIKAMSAHSESYKQMMEATVKTSGAKLNKEVTTVQERISRYVRLKVHLWVTKITTQSCLMH